MNTSISPKKQNPSAGEERLTDDINSPNFIAHSEHLNITSK